MHVYLRYDGMYVLVTGPTASDEYPVGISEVEALAMEKKVQFVQRLQEHATQLARIADVVADLNKLYFDRGYNLGGANAITDVDLAPLGLAANDVVLLITLLQQFDNFASGQAVVTGDYKGTMNRCRTDV